MSTATTAVLFPGQGAYYGRALADLLDAYPEVESVFAEIEGSARPLLGDSTVDEVFPARAHDVDRWLRDAPEALQLAIYAASVATYTVLWERGLRPDVLVGHSFGEISALVAARAFSVAEGTQIVCHRSLVLREAGLGDVYMAAVGADADRAQRLLDVVGDPQTVIAVENHPAQTVLSGRAETLDTVARLASTLRVDFVRLKSPYAFHSPLLEPVTEKFAERIRDIRQRPIETTVHSPLIGRAYRDSDVLTEVLARHLTARVRFADAIRELSGSGVSVFVESGALDALTRIVGRVAEAPGAVVPTLLPESDGADSIHQALGRLTAAGAIETPAPGRAQPQHAGRVLLPEVPSLDFERFWARRGNEVMAFARREYLAYAGVSGNGSIGRGSSFAPASAPAEAAGSETAGSETAAAGAAPASRSGSQPLDRSTLVRQLADAYAEALEYPSEVFAENTDLEAELGVDSVKQTELLVRVGDRYGLPPRPTDFRPAAYNTLGKIADLILTTGPSSGTAGDTMAPTTPTSPVAPAADRTGPAPNSTPGAPVARDRASLLAELVTSYAEALEYPSEVFAEDTDLEAELGVDSVKQTELLVRVGDRYGLPPRPTDFRPAAYNTLGKIADLILASA